MGDEEVSRSKLRRDRRALAVARYVKRSADMGCEEYTGTGRWGMASYKACAWLMSRKVHALWEVDETRYDRQYFIVSKMFGIKEW